MRPTPAAPRFHITGRPGPGDRPPLPSGHPLTWGLITRGTLLDSAEYPFPVFDCDAAEGIQG